jgi:hypothetical protein
VLPYIVAGAIGGLLLPSVPRATDAQEAAAIAPVEITAEALRDKIRGGLLGQILGNLNGLPHEMKYIDHPGSVQRYVPSLPEGAWTDDDTDFEWVYVVQMQRENSVLLPPDRICQLWQKRINRRIYCSNQYARQLMDLGLQPPLTGRFALNPWADFNISGQFLCETFGLLAPGMPQTAARIGLNYTQVAIDLEPAQTTQLFTSMIAMAFVTSDVEQLLDAGIRSVDPQSQLRGIIHDVRRWHRRHPQDWRATRERIKQKYSQHGGAMRDRNGYELNTASTIAALLYGRGELVETLRTAFNFGWDCDNTAATAGTIIGVTKGYRWMLAQGWQIVDRYRNTTRENMPDDETITSFADRLIDLAEQVIAQQGGQRTRQGGRVVYRIQPQACAPIASLPSLAEQTEAMQDRFAERIERGLRAEAPAREKARAAYLAICLDLAEHYRNQSPDAWQAGLRALNQYENVVQAIFHHAPFPAGDRLRERATNAGLARPAERKKLW